MITICFLLLGLASAMGLVAYAVWQRSRPAELSEFTHPQGFSATFYDPMLRLLNPSEFAFLEAQRGYTSAIGKAFRRERQQLFYEYLSALRHDFRLLDQMAHELLLASEVDRTDLAQALAWQRLAFHRWVITLHCALWLHRFGWRALPAGDAVGACEAFGRLVVQLQQSARPQMAGSLA